MPYIISNKDRRRLGLPRVFNSNSFDRVSNSNSLVKCLPIPEKFYDIIKELPRNYSKYTFKDKKTLYDLIEEIIDSYNFEYNLEFFTDIKEVPYGERNIDTDNQ